MKNEFPILYKRTNTGKVQTWQIIVEDGCFYTITGQTDGKKTTSKPTCCKPKNIGKANATNEQEQAIAEAQAKWDKKSKTGYFQEIDSIDDKKYVEPMLAKNFNDRREKVCYPVGVQIKFNGVRCVLTRAGAFSRTGERFLSIPHIQECFSNFFDKNPNAVLDGELFNENLRQNLNELVKLCRKTVHISEKDLESSRTNVFYYVYDGYNFGDLDKNKPYIERYNFISENLSIFSHYKKVETEVASTEEELFNIYQKVISENHEGVIVRNLNSSYENKRSSNLLKLKPEDDDEAIIVDVIEGEGNWSGTGKKLSLSWKDKIFDATLKSTMEEARDFLLNKNKWIGKKVTFLYNGLTGLGTPKFARVVYNNCIKGDR